MCADRVRPECAEHLVRLDAACTSGRRFVFLMLLIETISCSECHFPFITLFDTDQVIAPFQVNLGEDIGTLYSIM